MNRKKFLTTSTAIGLLPFISMKSQLTSNALNEVFKELLPKKSSPSLENSYWYIGHLMSVLISAEDTGGAFSLIHGFEIQGLEPPPHTHTKEDESFYLIQGEINFAVGEETYKGKPGDWIYLPKNIQHTFQVLTETAEVLILLTPGGFENYFIDMSEPAKELIIPPKPSGPPDVQKIVETASKYGILFPRH